MTKPVTPLHGCDTEPERSERMRPMTLQAANPSSRGRGATSEPRGRFAALLWTVQGLLAVVFLFAGGMKLVLPAAELTKQMAMPVLFLRFIGACETLGALGLILPGLLRIRPGLTPLAAAGLVSIMIGATVMTLASVGVAPALAPLVIGLLAAFVVYGRARLAPLHSRSQRRASDARWTSGARGVRVR